MTVNFNNLSFDNSSLSLQKVDFTNRDTVAGLVNGEFRGNREYIDAAMSMAEKIYETDPRSILDRKYGVRFSAKPEVLALAMSRFVQGKNVVEIAGASGENALFLAFAKPKSICVNDVVREEMEECQQNYKAIPKEIRKGINFRFLVGDCLKVDFPGLKETDEKVGLILCQNLIHFFTPLQKSELFGRVKRMLGFEGRAIFIVNGAYPNDRFMKAIEKDSLATTFAVNQFVALMGPGVLFSDILTVEVKEPEGYSQTYKNHFYIDKNATTGWKELIDKKLLEQFPECKDVFLSHVQKVKSLPQWNNPDGPLQIKILQTMSQVYTIDSLRELFLQNGFEVEEAFAVDPTGHITNNLPKAMQLGVIVKNPTL